MSTPSALSLQMVRLVQGAPRPPVREWFLFPAFADVTQAEALRRLDAAPKPVLLTPLLEAGCLGVWPIGALEPEARAAAERQVANRVAYVDAKLRSMWPLGVGSVRLIEGDTDLRLDLAVFLEWTRDHYVALGLGLERDADPRIARITIRLPGGGRRPIGLPAESRRPPAAENER